MTGPAIRGIVSGGFWSAECKDCQAELRAAGIAGRREQSPNRRRVPASPQSAQFGYSSMWAEKMLDRGNSRSDRCERHRKDHRKAIQAIAVPYVALQVIAEVADPNHPTGPLGGLGRLPLVHTEASVSVDLAGYEFGMSDGDILRLLEGLRTHQVAIVEAGTGTGKSTFMPFRLMRPPAGVPSLSRSGPIIVTEPRLAAAKGVARFVGEELCFGHDSRTCGSHIGPGFSVGYQVKGEKVWDSSCELVFVTDGTMVNWLRDGQLSRIGTVIVDEAHERSENIDIILSQLRDKVAQHRHLRVIVTSATLDKNFFVEFFGGSDNVFHMSVPAVKSFGYGVPLFPDVTFSDEVIDTGLTISNPTSSVTFPGWPELGLTDEGAEAENLRATTRQLAALRSVEPMELDEWKDGMPDAVARQVVAIALGTEWGDILAFLPTSASIAEAVESVCTRLGDEDALQQFDVYPLLSTTDKDTTVKATGARRRGDRRRIVISSNLAETSLTVKGVRYVVDSGLICQPEWDPEIASGSYPTKPHSQSGVKQRWGRVGRDSPGWVFPLYSSGQFLALPRNTPPGSAQVNLESFYLKLVAAGLDGERAVLPASFRHDAIQYDAEGLKVVETFERERLRAQLALKASGAIGNDGQLTEYGREIERFPGSGSDALAFMLAEQLACVHEVALALAVLGKSQLVGRGDCILGVDPRWPAVWQVEARQRHRALAYGCVDDLDLLLRLYHLWQVAPDPEDWCATWWVNEDVLKQGWADAMEGVRALSAAMKGEAERGVVLELAERARSVLTASMVSIRFERYNEETFQSLDASAATPQIAQLGRAALVDPGDRILAFGRFRVPAKDDGVSRVFISHAVRMSEWELCNKGAPDGLDLVLACANRDSGSPTTPSDPFLDARNALPVGTIVDLELGAQLGEALPIRKLHVVACPAPHPRFDNAGSVADEVSGFRADWDPLGVTTSEVPEEELSQAVVNSRSSEQNEPTVRPSVAHREHAEPQAPSSGEPLQIASVKSIWPFFPLAPVQRVRVAGYGLDAAGHVVLMVEPTASAVRDPYGNADLKSGDEVTVTVCGVLREGDFEVVQLARPDLGGYLFVDVREASLGNYDRDFAGRLAPGSSIVGVAVPRTEGGMTLTILPGLHEHLANYDVDTITVDGESTDFFAATVVEEPNKWGRLVVALDRVDLSDGPEFRFQVHKREFRGPLAERTQVGQQLQVALRPDAARNRGTLDLRDASLAAGFAKSHAEVFRLDGWRMSIRAPNVPPDLIRQLASMQSGKTWDREVWLLYASSLRLRVGAVRAKAFRHQLALPTVLAPLLRERRLEMQERFGVNLRVQEAALVVSGYDEAVAQRAMEQMSALSLLPRVIAKLPPGSAHRVLGKEKQNRKRLESLPGVEWVWVEDDSVGIIGNTASAVDHVLREIRDTAESASGQLTVSPGKNGLLIGRQGNTIQAIKALTGCRANNPGKGAVWMIEGPNAGAVREFIRRATSIAGGYGSVTVSKEVTITEDSRVRVVPPKPPRSAPESTQVTAPSGARPSQPSEQQSSGCFIATACFGDAEHPDVAALRRWKDTELSRHLLGRWFIDAYYRVSPPIARRLVQWPRLAAFLRVALSRIAKAVR